MMSYHSTSKNNIVRHKISYNFAFGSNCLSFILLKIFAFLLFGPIFLPISPDPFFLYLSYFSRFSQKITTPHEMPSSAQVRYYFDHNSGTTEPILMNFFFKYAQSDSLQQC